MKEGKQTDWEFVAIIVCATIVLILFWGTPSLMEAIVAKLTATPISKP